MSIKRPFEQVEQKDNDQWEKRVSRKHNRDYWFNLQTGATVWTNPISQINQVPIVSNIQNISSAQNTSTSSNTSKWTEHMSMKHNKKYWHNDSTGVTSWENPFINRIEETEEATINQLKIENKELIEKQSKEKIIRTLQQETIAAAVDYPTCPRVINSIDLSALVQRLRVESPAKESGKPEFEVIFTLAKDDLADITRAVQEDQILKTRLKLKRGNQVVDLPSFWDVWEKDNDLSKRILSSSDPNEEKWKCRRDFGYKIATTFMPPYAKSVYEHFNAESVLDPCAGWGDRLIGAAACKGVKRYVCFDPNRSLRPGYAKLMNLFGHSVTQLDDEHMTFSNSFQCNAQPFEIGALELQTESFDLVFTSPPFFDYEMYNPANPQYKNWINEFYHPLFLQSCRCVKVGGHVAIHIGDTSAGVIEPFLKQDVHNICPLKLIHRIGLKGLMSGETRTVWIFKKIASSVVPSPRIDRDSKTDSSPKKNTVSYSNLTPSVISNSTLKITDLIPLSKSRINILSNPPIQTLTIGNSSKSFLVYDDGHVIGGTKQRLLGKLLQEIKAEEVIYAGPDGGIAQVALAYTAAINRKKAVIFLNTYCKDRVNLPPLVLLAQALGAVIHLPDPNSSGRTLEDTQREATEYAAKGSERFILPFGLRGKPGEPNFDLFRDALIDSLRGLPVPKRYVRSLN